MKLPNQSHAIVLNTAVNLLQECYPGLTAERLNHALTKEALPKADSVMRKKLSRSECAQILGVSVNSINRYIKSGKLKAVNISPRLVRIDPESVEQLLQYGVPEDEIIQPQCHGKGSR